MGSLKGTAAIYNRMIRAGLKHLVDHMKEEMRIRYRKAGNAADFTNKMAHDKAWELFEPLVLQIEAEREEAGLAVIELKEQLKLSQAETKKALAEAKKAPVAKPKFFPHKGSVAELLDPNYAETDHAAQARDAFMWAGLNFRLVCVDSGETTRMAFSEALTPPPNALAVQIAEYYAQHRTKREKLLDRLSQFAAKPTPVRTKTGDESDTGDSEPPVEHKDDDVFGKLGLD